MAKPENKGVLILPDAILTFRNKGAEKTLNYALPI